MAITKTVALVTILVFATGAAIAQQQRNQPLQFPNPLLSLFSGTPQEQAACHPDVAKYCKDAGEDELRVLSCLQKNRVQISVSCRKVLESHGQ
jgi:hypothetical protein